MIRARQTQKLIRIRWIGRAHKKHGFHQTNTFRSLSSVSETSFAKINQNDLNTSTNTSTDALITSDKKRIKQQNIEAHQMRQQQEQKLKQERIKKRQEAHLKLTLIQRLQSTLQSQRNRRSEAAKALGPLFRMSPICYQDTMAALDLSTFHPYNQNNNNLAIQDLTKKNSRKARKKYEPIIGMESEDYKVIQHNNGLNSQYRKLYMNSINSFIHCLQTNPSSLFPSSDEQTDGTTILQQEELEKALVQFQDYETILESNANSLNKGEALLEELVKCGFDDGRFARKYRNQKIHLIGTTRTNARIQHKNEELKRRQARLQAAEEEYNLAINNFQNKKKARQEKGQVQEKGILNKLMDNFSDLFSSVDGQLQQKQLEHKLSPRAARRREYRKDVSNLKTLESKVKECKRLIQTTQSSILRLEAELDYPAHSLSKNDFEEVDAVMKRVLQELCPPFARHIKQRHAELVESYRKLDGMTDLTKPHEWYRQARKVKRKIIFHGGATNSGKTYTALQRLKEVKKGLYLGPLRLLAAEVYERLTADGILTNLYTGQEYIDTPNATHLAATTEIGPTNEKYDVVVIDEIQMIGDHFRGHAWTRALQGMNCKEIHLCGGMEALPLVEKIVHDCGDELEVKDEYKRFSNLYISDFSFTEESNSYSSFFDHDNNNVDRSMSKNEYRMVEPGDCVVAFSRNDIFAIKREIESTTNHKCSVIYGSLPPEIRVQQAQRFNDTNSDYNILIASDAIGMGLNLNIRRIIFNSMLKSDGEKIIQLPHTSVKQISGRAGRRNSPYPDGVVTCRNPEDMEYLSHCLNSDIDPIVGAGLLPSSSSIQEFSDALSTFGAENGENDGMDKNFDDLYVILQKFMEMATLQGDFFLCRQTAILRIAKYLADVPLSLEDKYTFCTCPVKTDDQTQMKVLKDYAYSLSKGEIRGIHSLSEMPQSPESFDDISRLCTLHNEMELFMWLCNRFPDNFVFEQSSLAIQEKTIAFINEGLVNSDNLVLEHSYKERDYRLRKNFTERKERELMGDPDSTEFDLNTF